MTSFEVIPAIDIREGKCVRLKRGRPDAQTVFSDDPVKISRGWEEQGAVRIHVVDLDGAFDGEPKNADLIKRVTASISVPVQVGGGIRTTENIRDYLNGGVDRVVVGTSALGDREWLAAAVEEFGERLVIGLDASKGEVMVKGWTRKGGVTAMEALARIQDAGARRLVFTSVERDGTLRGPDKESLEAVLFNSRVPVIASGGVRNLEDVVRLSRLRENGLEGVIVGMALYTGGLTLHEAVRRLSGDG